MSSCRLEPHGYSRLPHKHSSRVLDTGTVMDLDTDLNPNTVMDLDLNLDLATVTVTVTDLE